MSNSLKKKLVVILVLIIGAVICAQSFRNDRMLLDADEAAWIFNANYLEMYLAGDFDPDKWNEFDRYAQHPPGAAYPFGALMRAIDHPVVSMEPRRFWFEKDMLLVIDPDKFYGGLRDRIELQQIYAVRAFALVFGFACAALAMFFAMNTVGFFGGIVAFLLLILNPAYIYVSTIGTGDTFIMFISLAAIYSAMLLKQSRKKYLWALVFALSLGMALASKISSLALLPVALLVYAASRSNSAEVSVQKNFFKKVLPILVGFVGAIAFAIALDPGLWAHPIQETLVRIASRAERVDIQRMVFISGKLDGFLPRLSFASCIQFFGSQVGLTTLVMAILGIVLAFFSQMELRKKLMIVLVPAYFFLLTLAFLPMAWTRYVVTYMPFLVLLPAFGAQTLVQLSGDAKNGLFLRFAPIVIAVAVISGVFSAAYLGAGKPICEYSHKTSMYEAINAGMLASFLLGELPVESQPKLLNYLEKMREKRVSDVVTKGYIADRMYKK